jgi:hypothetical protein
MAFTFIAACPWHSATSDQKILRGRGGRRARASRLGHRNCPTGDLSIDNLELGLFSPESEQWHFVPNAHMDRIALKTGLMS